MFNLQSESLRKAHSFYCTLRVQPEKVAKLNALGISSQDWVEATRQDLWLQALLLKAHVRQATETVPCGQESGHNFEDPLIQEALHRRGAIVARLRGEAYPPLASTWKQRQLEARSRKQQRQRDGGAGQRAAVQAAVLICLASIGYAVLQHLHL
jgi:hypothetical protein